MGSLLSQRETFPFCAGLVRVPGQTRIAHHLKISRGVLEVFQDTVVPCNLSFFFFFLIFYLFIHERHREREREAETQGEGEAGSMQGA